MVVGELVNSVNFKSFKMCLTYSICFVHSSTEYISAWHELRAVILFRWEFQEIGPRKKRKGSKSTISTEEVAAGILQFNRGAKLMKRKFILMIRILTNFFVLIPIYFVLLGPDNTYTTISYL